MLSLLKKICARCFCTDAARLREVYASHAAFYAVASSLPMLLLILLVYARISPEDAAKLAAWLFTALPEEVADFLPEKLFSVSAGASAPLIPVTVLALVWSASKGLLAVFDGVRTVYGASDKRPALRKYASALLLTLIFLSVTVLSLCVIAAGPRLRAALSNVRNPWFDPAKLLTRSGRLLFSALFPLVCALLYKYASGKKGALSDHIAGAVFSGGGWLLFTVLLSLGLRVFGGAGSSLYGRFGALLLFMLWARVSMSILLFGAQINVELSKRRGP